MKRQPAWKEFTMLHRFASAYIPHVGGAEPRQLDLSSGV